MPSAKNKMFDAASHFQLVDIALWEASLKRQLDYMPARHEDHIAIQARDGIRAELLQAEMVDGKSSQYLRAFVTMGMRGVFEDPQKEEADVADEDANVIFEIDATFAVLYLMHKKPSDEDFQSFVRLNCVHNAWPFWRQHVFDTLKKASLPLVPVPFFQMQPQSAPSARLQR